MKPPVKLVLSIFIALSILSHARESQAKCEFALVRVAGKIVDIQTKKPIDGAQVVGFIDGDGIHFSEKTRSDSVTLKTSEDGNYGGEFLFDRYSGLRFFILPDACDNTPDKLELIAIKDGYLPAKVKIKVKKPAPAVKTQWPHYDYVASAPDIGLIPLNPSCEEAFGTTKKDDVQRAPRPIGKRRSGL